MKVIDLIIVILMIFVVVILAAGIYDLDSIKDLIDIFGAF